MSRVKLRDLHWTFPWLAGFLGTLGGWHWKIIRRAGIPLFGATMALGYGIAWWRTLGYLLTTFGAFTLPYSPNRASIGIVWLVGASYGATPIILSRKWKSRLWWPLLTGTVFASLMILSLEVNWFTWKWVEGAIFWLHGFLVSWVIDKEKSEL